MIKLDKITYAGWPNALRLSNGKVELVVTLDVGPRIIRLAFENGKNLFKEIANQSGVTAGDTWRLYGGHRLWHAPEARPRTYYPDNEPVEYDWDGTVLRLIPPLEKTTLICKEIDVKLHPHDEKVIVTHRLINRNQWAIEVAPWSISVMADGGRAIIPNEVALPNSDTLLPARPMAVWYYTDMSDPRFIWGKKYIQVRQDPTRSNAQKIGVSNRQGWAAYTLPWGTLIKRYAFSKSTYPDFGCNTEVFTNDEILELETLGPLTILAPGGSVEHEEEWLVRDIAIGDSEEAIDKSLLSIKTH